MPEYRRECSVPRQPIIGWSNFSWHPDKHVPSIADSGHSTFTWSGRSALLLALRDIGVHQGDRILVPNYYCPTMIAPIVRSGATPLFYPINCNAEADAPWLHQQELTGVKAMFAVHFFGLPRRLDRIATFCRQRCITLIEDCAHAYFGSIQEHPVGSWGDYAIGSLPKFFPVMQGGVLVGKRPLVGTVVAKQRALIELKVAWDLLDLSTLYHGLPGLNRFGGVLRTARNLLVPTARNLTADGSMSHADPTDIMTTAVADPLLEPIRLRRLEQLVVDHADRRRIADIRRRNYLLFSSRLRSLQGIQPLFPELPDGAVPYVFPVFLNEPDRPYETLRRLGYPVFRWDRMWPWSPSDDHDTGPSWARHVLQLSCHQDLTEADVERITSSLRNSLRA